MTDKKVLILQHDRGDPPGLLGDLLKACNIPFEVVNTITEPVPETLMGYAAMLSLGGRQYAGDHEKYLLQEQVLIRHAVEQEVPFLGICLGGQLLAQVLGAKVARHALSQIGFYEVELTEAGKHDPLFQGIASEFQQVFHWHSDVFALPSGSVLLATNESIAQAFRFGACAYGLQYHIELTPGMLTSWLSTPFARREAVEVLGQEGFDAIEKVRATKYPIYCEHTRIVFENFLQLSGLI